MPIDATRSWTAKFESWDARSDDCYYVVTLFDGDAPTKRIMAKICLGEWADIGVPGFIDWLRDSLAEIAVTGNSNTDYKGSMAAWMAGGGKYPVD